MALCTCKVYDRLDLNSVSGWATTLPHFLSIIAQASYSKLLMLPALVHTCRSDIRALVSTRLSGCFYPSHSHCFLLLRLFLICCCNNHGRIGTALIETTEGDWERLTESTMRETSSRSASFIIFSPAGETIMFVADFWHSRKKEGKKKGLRWGNREEINGKRSYSL